MEKLMTATTFTLDGFQIVCNLGVVRSIVVRSHPVLGTIGGILHTLISGNITLFTELCEKTRGKAFEMTATQSLEMAAIAIVGVRYDATEVMGGVTALNFKDIEEKQPHPQII
jgi:uncharacterized protein YbjQ (UPF0145 family)